MGPEPRSQPQEFAKRDPARPPRAAQQSAEFRSDRRDLREDRRELRQDFRSGASPEEIARDKADVSRSLQEFRDSRGELREDRRELNRDLREYDRRYGDHYGDYYYGDYYRCRENYHDWRCQSR